MNMTKDLVAMATSDRIFENNQWLHDGIQEAVDKGEFATVFPAPDEPELTRIGMALTVRGFTVKVSKDKKNFLVDWSIDG